MEPGFRVSVTANEIFVSKINGTTTGPWHAFYVGSSGKVCFEAKAAPPPEIAVTRRFNAYAIYGSFKLLRGYYICFATDARFAAPAPRGGGIYKITQFDWIPLGRGTNTSSSAATSSTTSGGGNLTSEEEEEESTYLSLLKQVADTRSFYFGIGCNPTRSLQREAAAASDSLLSLSSGGGSNNNHNNNNNNNNPTLDGNSASPSSASASGAAAAPSDSSSSGSSEATAANGNTGGGTSSSSAAAANSSGASSPILASDEPYFWNRSAASCIIASRALDFITPIMNGFVGAIDVSPDFDFTLVLISRRGSSRQGTRFYMRGADADGNVANLVESEQVLLFGNGAVSSFVQFRGSIPLLWDQTPTGKYTPKCALSDKKPRMIAAFQRHIETAIARYNNVAIVNLIDKKGDQKKLGDTYQEACNMLGAKGVTYTWFDFHAKCKKTWETLRELLNEMEPTLASNGCFVRDANGSVTATQAGVMRTNCMDNLDRTNVVQSLFARRAALAMIPGALAKAKGEGSTLLSSSFAVFDTRFNNLWADNADAISLLYSGTPALKTDFTRTGKRAYLIGKALAVGDLVDGKHSVTRYILNNFVDGRTQDAWDLFLGNYIPERSRGGGGGASSAIRAHMAEYTPVGILVRVATLFVSVSAAIAYLLTHSSTSLFGFFSPSAPNSSSSSPSFLSGSPLLWGMAGAFTVVGGLAALLMKNGSKAVGGGLISRPHLCPPTPVTALDASSGGAGMSGARTKIA